MLFTGTEPEVPEQEVLTSKPAEPVLVFLVRHAEKGQDDARDPSLSDAGRARARELARVLGAAPVTHLFSTEYKRTRETLAPLAARHELEVTVVSARERAKQLAQLRALPPGSVAVVAGHSNTVPDLARELCGVELVGLERRGSMQLLPESAYDRLVQVVLPGGTAGAVRGIELRYGP